MKVMIKAPLTRKMRANKKVKIKKKAKKRVVQMTQIL